MLAVKQRSATESTDERLQTITKRNKSDFVLKVEFIRCSATRFYDYLGLTFYLRPFEHDPKTHTHDNNTVPILQKLFLSFFGVIWFMAWNTRL